MEQKWQRMPWTWGFHYWVLLMMAGHADLGRARHSWADSPT